MYERILLALDAQRVAAAAVPVVAALAGAPDAEVLVVHVRDIERELRTRYEAQQLVDRTVGRLRAAGVRARGEARSVAAGDVATDLLDSARWFRADLIVLGSHGRGELGGLLLGSVGQRVAAGTDAAVVLVHGDPRERSRRWPTSIRRILLAVDRSEREEAAIRAALGLCRQHGASVSIVHVHPAYELPSSARDHVAGIAGRFHRAGAGASAVSPAAGFDGVPVQIADLAERTGADLIVIGSRRRGGLAAVLLGSTARALVRVTARPVLLAETETRETRQPAAWRPPAAVEAQ